MLLAVDVGNTQTVFGLYSGAEALGRWRVATEPERTADELGVLVDRLLDLQDRNTADVDAACLASTVPVLVREYESLAERYLDATMLVVGPGIKTGIPIRVDDPREVGPDRIANAVAARERYGAPCVVVDFGTATNFDAVSAAGEYVGGAIAPGIETSMDALFARAARLVKVDFVPPPQPIGTNTVHALQSGCVFGFAGQIDGIVGRIRSQIGEEAKIVATGGLASLIAPHSEAIDLVDADLTLEGLRLLWEHNQDDD
jgi:type III pantothenate kinase